MSTTQATKPPVHTIRYGSVKASIWENQTRFGMMYNVTVARSYKEFEQWKDSYSFSFDDLLILAKAVDECHTWIHEHMKNNGKPADSAGK